MKTSQVVEAVLFASDAPLKAEEIARADETLDEDGVEAALRELMEAYAESDRAFQVVQVAEGYQIQTRPEFASYLERFDTVPRPSRLSGPALETLAIIAYRQPIGRVEVEYIRGVGSVGVIRTLQDRALVEVVGRAEGIGRPLLYGTTSRFLEHFGFDSLDDLPRPDELPVVLRDNPPLDEEEGDAGGAADEGDRADADRDDGPEADRDDGAEAAAEDVDRPVPGTAAAAGDGESGGAGGGTDGGTDGRADEGRTGDAAAEVSDDGAGEVPEGEKAAAAGAAREEGPHG